MSSCGWTLPAAPSEPSSPSSGVSGAAVHLLSARTRTMESWEVTQAEPRPCRSFASRGQGPVAGASPARAVVLLGPRGGRGTEKTELCPGASCLGCRGANLEHAGVRGRRADCLAMYPPVSGAETPVRCCLTPPRPVRSSLWHGCFWTFAVLLEIRTESSPESCPRGGPWSGVGLRTPDCVPIQPARVGCAAPARHRAQDLGVEPGGCGRRWGAGTWACSTPHPSQTGAWSSRIGAEQVSRVLAPSPWEPGLVSLPPAFREASS